MFQLLQVILPDGGPVYAETDTSHIVAEPFNAISAALFIIIAVYWLWRATVKEGTKNSFFIPSLIILLIGGVGGTIYHAFRAHSFFLYMDWVPILILCVIACVYFLKLLNVSWKRIGTGIITIFAFQYLNFNFVPPHIAVNLSYAILGLTVLTPLVLYMRKTQYRYAKEPILALVSFALALSFRISDKMVDLPMGTHFLWHTFGAFTAFFLLQYMYRLPLEEN